MILAEKKQKEQEAKDKLKQQVLREAALKAAETMMISLDISEPKGSNQTEVVNTTHDFSHAINLTIISSLPSKPDAINISSSLCNNSVQIEDVYDDTRGLKMMFAQG